MVLALLAEKEKEQEFRTVSFAEGVEIIVADSLRSFAAIDADMYFYLRDLDDPGDLSALKLLVDRPLLVNCVSFTTKEFQQPIIRMNGWNTMIARPLVELAPSNSANREELKKLFQKLGWDVEFAPDIVGMIVPGIVAMIINEAYFTLESGVSSREEIDTAMKLGTNYPYGPFEWSRKIGLKNVKTLLQEMARLDRRYEPCALLSSEASGASN